MNDKQAITDTLGLSEELNAYMKMNREICSLCEIRVRKCFVVCDNVSVCGKRYCSDSCAEADKGHHLLKN